MCSAVVLRCTVNPSGVTTRLQKSSSLEIDTASLSQFMTETKILQKVYLKWKGVCRYVYYIRNINHFHLNIILS